MSKKDKPEPVTQPCSEPLSSDEMPQQSEKEIQADYEPTPPRPPSEHKIHPRQKIPPVPEGDRVYDESPSPPVDLD